ncbi:hypothetical protein STEG23_026291, partial [Scotinomys teguina]
TYQFAMEKPNTRLSELHAYHSSLTCFSEGTRVSVVTLLIHVTEKMWGCCPSHWKPFGSSCYFMSTNENIWSISEQKCIEMGAHLVVINTEAEQKGQAYQVAVKLGNSSPIKTGQGNPVGGKGPKIVIFCDGLMVSIFCKRSCFMRGGTWNCCPISWTAFQSNCYFPLTDNQTWSESERNCSGMGGHLVTINTKEEQKRADVQEMTARQDKAIRQGGSPHTNAGQEPEILSFISCVLLNFVTGLLDKQFPYFLGLTDENVEGLWQWVDQTPFNPRMGFWHKGEPNNFMKEDCVVLINVKDKWAWNDFPCHFEASRIFSDVGCGAPCAWVSCFSSGLPCRSTASAGQISCFSLNIPASPGYYQDGDFIIGGLFSLKVTFGDNRSRFGFDSSIYIPDYVYADLTKHYQHMLAMIFAIEKINKDPNILYNMSLGFYNFNINFIEMKAMESSMALLSGESPPIPNYSCRPEKSHKLVAVIGGISTGMSTQISRVLSLYNIPQISYAPFDQSLGTRVHPQSPYQFPVDTAALYQGIIQLLLNFNWIWVGLVVPDDMRGELFLRDITEEMTTHGLCVAFAEKIPEFPAEDTTNRERFTERFTLTNVIVVYGDTYSLLRFAYNIFCNTPLGNVWVTTLDWDITTLPFDQSLSYTYFGGGLSFSVHMDEILGFKDFLRSVQPGKYPHDIFIQDVWSILFECPYFDQHFMRELSQCEQNGTLATRALHVWDMNTSPLSYKVHTAVYTIAQALHEELSLRMEGDSVDKGVPPAPLPWKVAMAGFVFLWGHRSWL